MDNRFRTFLDRFLFDNSKRRLSYILLAIFFLVVGLAVVQSHYLADEIVYPSEVRVVYPDDVIGVAEDGTPITAASKNKSAKKSAIVGSTNGSGSAASGESGSSGGSTTGGSAFVAFYADSQSDTDEEDARHLAVVNNILATGANPVIHAGDLMEDGTQASFDRFLNVAGTLISARTFYSALGNNDRLFGDASTPSPIYLNYFSFPGNERWYSVNSGNLHVVVLDSAFAFGSATQLAWLAADLSSAESQSRITVVVFHHPSFASSIESSLVNFYADFVVDGHTHSYAKTVSNGVYYFTLPGGSGLGYCTAQTTSTTVNFVCRNSSKGLIDSTTFSPR